MQRTLVGVADLGEYDADDAAADSIEFFITSIVASFSCFTKERQATLNLSAHTHHRFRPETNALCHTSVSRVPSTLRRHAKGSTLSRTSFPSA
jgi:hypothetical protein